MEMPEELTPDELEAQHGEELPDREAMSVLRSDFGPMPPEIVSLTELE